MNDIKDSGFKCYIDENELESITLNDSQRTKILDGETVVCESQNVCLYAPLTDRKKYTLGILTVTTFKLSFASADDDRYENCYQQNLLLGVNDVCLSSIDVIYQLGERSRKKLVPGQNVTGKVKELLIVCKNMKSYEFSFKNAEKDSGKKIANALLHHAYPKIHTLLFAYENKEPYIVKPIKDVRFFRHTKDWKKELERTKCANWRISHINENYQTSPLLIEALIVPQSLQELNLQQAVEHFRNRCCPLWIWGTQKGAALVRMADLLPTITDRIQENTFLEHIRRSHPEKKQPHIIDLSRDCPSPKEIYLSFLKLRDLCIPENTRVFKNQDFKFYGLLDNTKWLTHISTCLTRALEASEQIHVHNCTVVLQEGNGQDMNCVISSLTQLLLDPYFRTMTGFQSLIQKDWVAMGHPFADRLGHTMCKDTEPSPLFLVFLDCVWQLLQQFPQAFQISETYLTTVWDSCHMSVFDTFLFNCEHDRCMAEKGLNHSRLVLRSVWDWKEQFTEKDIIFFCNPLYDDSMKTVLKPRTGLSSMEVWMQCYFRWLPELEIRGGGKPQIDLCVRLVATEIALLQQKYETGEINGRLNRYKEEHMELMRKVNSFFPFSQNSGQIDIEQINNILLSGDVLETQSILNLND